MKAAEEKLCPIHFVRFEDLITNPYPVLKAMFEFVMDVESIDGTYLDYRIRKAANPELKASVLYKPRAGAIDKNRDLYTEAQVDHLKAECKNALVYFGYAAAKGEHQEEQFVFLDYEKSEVEG
jgi:hypothetical protein